MFRTPEKTKEPLILAEAYLPLEGQQTKTQMVATQLRPSEITDEQLNRIREKLPANFDKLTGLEKTTAVVEVLKKGGTLGIVYEDATNRPVKSPSEMLTPDSNGKLRGDCEELALTFMAVAEKLGIGDDKYIICMAGKSPEKDKAGKVMTDEKGNPAYKDSGHAATMAIFQIENKVFLIDLTSSGNPMMELELAPENAKKPEELKGALEKAYASKFKDITVKSILETKEQREAFYYEQAAGWYYKRGNWSKVIETEKDAEEAGSVNPALLVILGSVYSNIDKYPEAEKTYKQALGIDPNNENAKIDFSSVLNNEGIALSKHGDYEGAIAKFNEALTYSPKDEVKIKNISNAYVRMGIGFNNEEKYEEADSLFDIALKYNPNNETAKENLGVAYYGLAVNICNKATSSTNSSEKMEKLKTAISLLEKALEYQKKDTADYKNTSKFLDSLKNELDKIKSRKE
jgi:tetratricopeptide (TPR) repeat protein